MHAGDKPYVVSPTGQVDLATRGLALDAVNGIVNQLLPQELQQALDEFGAVQHELAPLAEFPGEHFTIVAARGGDDVWVEIRRRRIPDDDRVPEELFNSTDVTTASPYPVYAAAGSPSLSRPVEPLPDSLEVGDIGISREESSYEESPYQDSLEVDVDLNADLPLNPPETPETPEPVEPVAPVVQPPPAPRESQAAIERRIEEAVVLPPPAPPLPVAPPAPPLSTALPPAVVAAPSLVVVEAPPPVVVEAPPPIVVEAPPPIVVEAPPPIVVEAPPPIVVEAPPPIVVEAPAPVAAPPPVAVVVEPARPPEPVAPPVSAVEPVFAPLAAPAAEAEAPSVPPPVAEPPTVVAMPVAVAVPLPVEPAPAPVVAVPPAAAVAAPAEPDVVPEPPPAVVAAPPAASISSERPAPVPVPTPGPTPMAAPAPVAASAPPPVDIAPPPVAQPAVVLPLARNPIRAEQPWPPVGDARTSGLDRLLRLSAARGASTLYLSSDSRPAVRVDGELQMLDGEPVLTARDVESLLLTLMPERNHEALRTGAATEWILDIEDVGRVRCMSFRDHRGPGGVFRLMPTRSVSADQLGLSREIQALAIEPEGLVLVAGPRSSGKRTLISAFVDLINRTRRDHVITIEREINIVHERGNSFVSQREVRGNDEDMLAAARAALREDPDVLVIEDLRSAALMTVALDAAASGHLVIGGFSAHTATGAVDRIIDLYAPEHRRQVQLGAGRQPPRRRRPGAAAQDRRRARRRARSAAQYAGGVERDRRRQDLAAAAGDRRRPPARHGAAQRRARRLRAERQRRRARSVPPRRPIGPGFLAALKRQGLDTSLRRRRRSA